ncbi:aquaporin AQPcic-like isoform X2 [Lucilia sericata]|uniref:aquaporin AQPcic-like isoform X2 n=1 Tax=Lucilia sericata TaxID=13632 RepID=UPI0018A80AEF|nr:aquaporin AQPcic-like isoform X2 [Lucilia sericata]
MKSLTNDIVSRLLAEFVGTTILVFLGCLGCAGNEYSLFKIAFNMGFTVMLIVQSLGCVSGAHLSPAITLAAYIMNLISPLLSVGYFCAQLLGCFTGYALLMFLIPSSFLPTGPNDDGFCLTLPHPELGYMQAVAIEFIITATLVFFACSFWDPRNAEYGKTIPIKFGFAIICLACTAGNFTGASMNPARSLAPALWNNNYKYQGVYWIGPLGAAVVSSYLYKLVFWRDVQE